MSERTCKGCGATFRKGRRRMLFGAPGVLESTIVCVSCADRALCIVAPLVPPTEVKRYVADPQLRTMLAKLWVFREVGTGRDESWRDGFQSGLDSAIALVKAAIEGRPL
jgi:hypothetical protein